MSSVFCRVFVFFGILWSIQGWSQIRESTSLKDALRNAHRHTLIVVDVDYTLIQPLKMMYGEAFYTASRAEILRRVPDSVQAAHQEWQTWKKIRYLFDTAPHELLEADTDVFLQDMRFVPLSMMAMAARSPENATETVGLLNSLGIDFGALSPRLHAAALLLAGETYKDGVLFVDNGANKGEALEVFLAATEQKFQAVIFVDDNLKHLQDVEQAMKSIAMPFEGIHFKPVNSRVNLSNSIPEAISKLGYRALCEAVLSPERAKLLLDEEWLQR